jgi:putative ABC transport system permease protein
MQAFVAAAIGEVAQVVEFARWLGWLAVLVIALVLANTVFISAQSRGPEMGVLETIGMTKPRLVALVTAEGVGLGLVGGAIGTAIVIALLSANSVTLGVEGYGIDLAPGAGTALAALGASFVTALLASLGPAIAVVSRPLHVGVKEE